MKKKVKSQRRKPSRKPVILEPTPDAREALKALVRAQTVEVLQRPDVQIVSLRELECECWKGKLYCATFFVPSPES